MQKKTLRVQKTARYFVLGESGPHIRECWFVLHGYAQTASSFLSRFEPVQRDYRLIIAPEGLHRFYREGLSGKTGASWMTSDDRQDDIRDYLDYFNQLIAMIRDELPPECRFLVLGFSQGGATAVRWVQENPGQFYRAILWGAAFPPDMKIEKLLAGPPWWCFAGNNDPFLNATFEENKILINSLLTSVEYFNYEGGHQIPELPLLELEKMLHQNDSAEL